MQIWNKAICERLTVQQYAPSVFAANVGNNAPLIGFRRSSLHGTVLVAGGLSAELYALDPIRNQFVYKGKAFEQWYNQIARWIRRHYERDPKYGMCIGPNAQQLFERGEIQLAQFMTAAGR